MKKGDVIRQKRVNTTFYLTGILAHKVNNSTYHFQIHLNFEIKIVQKSWSEFDNDL